MRFLLLLFLCCIIGGKSYVAHSSDTIPLCLAHGLLVIPVQIDGQGHNFILDTGMTRLMMGTVWQRLLRSTFTLATV